MRKMSLAALLLASCVTTETQPLPQPPPPRAPSEAPPPPPSAGPPAPPPPRQALISEGEAVRIASNFARSRGLSVQRYRAKLDPQQRWVVELKQQNGDDRAKVLIDARDGRLLRAKLKHDSDDDWD